MGSSMNMHKTKKKIFIHEDCRAYDDGRPYTSTTISYVASGIQHSLTLFSDEAGLPEFIKTNESLIPIDWFDEDYEGSYQDEENTDDNETGSTSGADAG